MTTGQTLAIVGGGLAVVYLLSRQSGGLLGTAPASAAQLAQQRQAQQIAALQAQNSGLTGLLTKIFGKGMPSQNTPQSKPSGIGGSAGSASGGSGASRQSSCPLGSKNQNCPITNKCPVTCPTFCPHGCPSDTQTPGGQFSTPFGPPAPCPVVNAPDLSGNACITPCNLTNNCGGINTAPGGVAPFICPSTVNFVCPAGAGDTCFC
jgi:hypothetical protein